MFSYWFGHSGVLFAILGWGVRPTCRANGLALSRKTTHWALFHEQATRRCALIIAGFEYYVQEYSTPWKRTMKTVATTHVITITGRPARAHSIVVMG